ncbi:MAG: hypothetical protein GY832_21880 [Chloroflexi bacterium]|nr:hypothetical protein [Chloroflexota bacterium]
MIGRIVVVILFLLVTACNGVTETTSVQGTGVVFPSGSSLYPDAHIQEVAKQQLNQGDGGYFMLQFSHSLGQDTRATLEGVNVVFYDYVPNYAYYVFLPPESLAALEQLMEAGTVRHVGSIPVEAKLEAGLGEKIQADTGQRFDVIVQFFEEPPLTVKEELEALMEVREYTFGPVNMAKGIVAGTDVETILSLPFVKWMEEQIPMELGD